MQVFGITDATAITAGNRHSCALRQDGTISCWGINWEGQLGNGNEARSVIPVQVAGISDATAIAAGNSFSCALHQDGTISCWGSNWEGQLGNGQSGENAHSPLPVKVTGITDATAIAAGNSFSCALHQDSTISCWGKNSEGQLGNGQTPGYGQFSSLPVKVTGITDATAIATGWLHSCALHQNGTISCWGGDALGNGQDAVSPVPLQVFGISDATAINIYGHSCALHRGGTISCWGNNYWGQLGNGQSGRNAGLVSHSLVPVKVTGITDATAIATGDDHSCALHQNDTISCWGNNSEGQLGDGTTRNRSTPVRVTGFGS